MIVAPPRRASTSLTNDRTKALVSVSSLVLRNSLMSWAKAAMMSVLSSSSRLLTSTSSASMVSRF